MNTHPSHILALALLVTGMSAYAEPKPDDFGGLMSYPVPRDSGGASEFRYCVVYAKRAWRVANLASEQAITLVQAKRWATESLGRSAAIEEIEDFERLEKGAIPSPSALAGDRFYRCAVRLKLNPEPRHKANAEFCFRSIALLDQVARLRADGKSQEQATATIASKNPAIDKRLLSSTVNLAFSGPSLAEDSSLIEDVFAECFAQAGERQNAK